MSLHCLLAGHLSCFSTISNACNSPVQPFFISWGGPLWASVFLRNAMSRLFMITWGNEITCDHSSLSSCWCIPRSLLRMRQLWQTPGSFEEQQAFLLPFFLWEKKYPHEKPTSLSSLFPHPLHLGLFENELCPVSLLLQTSLPMSGPRAPFILFHTFPTSSPMSEIQNYSNIWMFNLLITYLTLGLYSFVLLWPIKWNLKTNYVL